jgi:hypothetical protein
LEILAMTPGFQTKDVTIRTSDGLNVYLVEPLEYVAKNGVFIRVEPGAYTNGASTPRGMWTALPPFGVYYLAACLHDFAYDDMLTARMSDGTFAKFTLPKEQCDQLFLEAMESLGVDQEMRAAIFEGVNIGGQAAFDLSRKEVNGVLPA